MDSGQATFFLYLVINFSVTINFFFIITKIEYTAHNLQIENV